MTGVGLAQTALSELLADILFFENGFDFACFSASENLDQVSSELESSNGDDLSADTLSVDQDSLVAENVDDSGEVAGLGTEGDSSDATDLNKFGVALNETLLTIFNCGEIY